MKEKYISPQNESIYTILTSEVCSNTSFEEIKSVLRTNDNFYIILNLNIKLEVWTHKSVKTDCNLTHV
jgi:hypothetical protein